MLQKLLANCQRVSAFLDVDGTLVDIAPTPSTVVLAPHVRELLYQLWVHLDGALALVSGRPLDDLDLLFEPYRFPAAGVHGCEIREPSGCLITPSIATAAIRAIHDQVSFFEFTSPGVLVEYKAFGVAIHYRLSPEAESEVAACAQSIISSAGPAFAVQRGKCVYEIKPVGVSKGLAIRTFMEASPFRGRTPLFIGDDATDESGFEAVNLAGGMSVRVGDPRAASLARYAVASPSDVHQLLSTLVQRPV